jgi:hypothetical protein
VRDHHAAIAHIRRQQSDVAADSGMQIPIVDDAARRTVARQSDFAGHEVGIADAVGGRRQAAHVHRSAFAEVHAVGIAEENLTGARDLAEDLARVAIEHPVERRRTAVGLDEVDLGSAAQVEGVPIDNRALRGLIDVEHRRPRGCDGS